MNFILLSTVLGVMENLVGDVRKMTYTTMPATLARPITVPRPGQKQSQPTQGKD